MKFKSLSFAFIFAFIFALITSCSDEDGNCELAGCCPPTADCFEHSKRKAIESFVVTENGSYVLLSNIDSEQGINERIIQFYENSDFQQPTLELVENTIVSWRGAIPLQTSGIFSPYGIIYDSNLNKTIVSNPDSPFYVSNVKKSIISTVRDDAIYFSRNGIDWDNEIQLSEHPLYGDGNLELAEIVVNEDITQVVVSNSVSNNTSAEAVYLYDYITNSWQLLNADFAFENSWFIDGQVIYSNTRGDFYKNTDKLLNYDEHTDWYYSTGHSSAVLNHNFMVLGQRIYSFRDTIGWFDVEDMSFYNTEVEIEINNGARRVYEQNGMLYFNTYHAIYRFDGESVNKLMNVTED